MKSTLMRPVSPLIVLTLLATAAPLFAQWGDYKHDFLDAVEREDRFQLFGYFAGDWRMEERESADSSGIEWRNSFGDRSRAALWIAGSTSPRVSYFAEGVYHPGDDSFHTGPVRADVTFPSRAVALRFGRFYFPFGIEMRSAPARANRFISRPDNMSRITTGIGVYGDILNENLNYFLAVANRYPSEIADSLDGVGGGSGDGDRDDEKAWGGRVALSPRLGVELGFSYAWERYGAVAPREARMIGGDFSVEGGPLHLQAEISRLRRDGVNGEVLSTLFHGRLAYRIVEDSEHFEAIDLLAGAGLDDPGEQGVDDRLTTWIGGLAIAPARGLSFRMEYQARREQGRERRNDLWMNEILLFW